MKKTVFDIQDLQHISPVFKKKFFAFWGKKFLKWLSFEKVNKIHSDNCHFLGSEFTSAILADPLMDVKYKIHHEERLDTLPKEGAFITVSNHPIGSLDGIILLDIFGARRKDFKIMVNEILAKVGAMADNMILVLPNTGDNTKGNSMNINGVRTTLSWIKDGHPMGFFPAGAMSFKNKKKQVKDRPWTHSVIRLIRKVKIPVYPVFFDCQNSNFFYWLGKISWKIRTLRTPEEAFNKRGKTLNIHIGHPISPQTIQQYPDDTELADFLYRATYDSSQ
jgi:putative hemolysin